MKWTYYIDLKLAESGGSRDSRIRFGGSKECTRRHFRMIDRGDEGNNLGMSEQIGVTIGKILQLTLQQ